MVIECDKKRKQEDKNETIKKYKYTTFQKGLGIAVVAALPFFIGRMTDNQILIQSSLAIYAVGVAIILFDFAWRLMKISEIKDR
jgi:hypothetical protein